MGFMNNLKSESNLEKNLTENCAVAYRTSGDEFLDFNFRITDLRSCEEKEIISAFKKLFYTDKILSIKYLFYVGDIREGLGERHIFRSCISWLAKTNPNHAKKVLHLISEYSRWDILVSLITEKPVKDEVRQIIYNQLTEDETNRRLNKPVSLLAKWLPSENTSSYETRKLANVVIKELGMTPRNYRKTLSGLRSYLDVVEVKMSNKSWDEIDYESVPSKANLIYSEAFMRNDSERRKEYLRSLTRGEVKINASVTQPHEIVCKYTKGGWGIGVGKYDETLEQLWKALPTNTVGKTLVVRDGSGSMTQRVTGKITALDVATALSVYCAEQCKGEFYNKFITFSHRPKLVDLSGCDTLHDKLDIAYDECEISDTNIYKTMELVLNTAVNNNMKQDELPDTILIISDMQFNGTRFTLDESLFDEIKKEFETCGYKLPKICFWNLCSYDSKTIPLQQNEYGLILCSGFSINNLKMFMSGEVDPLKVLLETINSERYEKVEKALVA